MKRLIQLTTLLTILFATSTSYAQAVNPPAETSDIQEVISQYFQECTYADVKKISTRSYSVEETTLTKWTKTDLVRALTAPADQIDFFSYGMLPDMASYPGDQIVGPCFDMQSIIEMSADNGDLDLLTVEATNPSDESAIVVWLTINKKKMVKLEFFYAN